VSRRVVVYADTNVLYPYYVSDLLLWLASDGVIRLVWTQYLVDEVIDVVPRRRLARGLGRDESAVRSQWDAARAHLMRDEVSEPQWRTKMSLAAGPDADDHPHQAAAIYAKADYLLTHDRTGFPAGPLLAHGVTVIGVDGFLCTMLAEQRDDVLVTVRRRASSLTRPSMTLERYLETLALTAPQFAELAARASDTPLSRIARLRVRLRRTFFRRAGPERHH
jgi:predicted nucleic acid-binding protein